MSEGMESNGCDEVKVSGSGDTTYPEATIEIKIKTMDSQTYTMRVDKSVPVPALKEQIATVTGVLSEQQRLICRGQVLKDDQLLSAYHVEDGHTLHLVVRQPIHPSMDSSAYHSANHSARSYGRPLNEETFNVTEPGDGLLPEFTRQLARQRQNQASVTDPSVRMTTQSNAMSTGVLLHHLGAMLLELGRTTMSLTTGQTPDGNLAQQSVLKLCSRFCDLILVQTEAVINTDPAMFTSASRPYPIMVQPLHSQPGARFGPTSTGIGQHGAVLPGGSVDSSSLQSILEIRIRRGPLISSSTPIDSQREATGIQQPLGQRNQTTPDAPAASGSPLPTRPLIRRVTRRLVVIPRDAVQQALGLSNQSTPDIRSSIHADAPAASGPPLPTRPLTRRVTRGVLVIPRDATGIQQPLGLSNQSTPDIRSSIHADAPAASGPPLPISPLSRQVRIIPRDAIEGDYGLPLSIIRQHGIPLRTFVQHRMRQVSNGNLGNQGGPQSSERVRSGGLGSGQQPNSSSTASQDGTGLPVANANGPIGNGAQNVRGFLGSIFSAESIHTRDVNLQGMGRSSARSNSRTNQGRAAATSQESEPVSSNGGFFSHLLHHVLPMISENTIGGSAREAEDVSGSRDMQTSSAQGHENTDSGTRSRRRGNEPSSPGSKRQRG